MPPPGETGFFQIDDQIRAAMGGDPEAKNALANKFSPTVAMSGTLGGLLKLAVRQGGPSLPPSAALTKWQAEGVSDLFHGAGAVATGMLSLPDMLSTEGGERINEFMFDPVISAEHLARNVTDAFGTVSRYLTPLTPESQQAGEFTIELAADILLDIEQTFREPARTMAERPFTSAADMADIASMFMVGIPIAIVLKRAGMAGVREFFRSSVSARRAYGLADDVEGGIRRELQEYVGQAVEERNRLVPREGESIKPLQIGGEVEPPRPSPAEPSIIRQQMPESEAARAANELAAASEPVAGLALPPGRRAGALVEGRGSQNLLPPGPTITETNPIDPATRLLPLKDGSLARGPAQGTPLDLLELPPSGREVAQTAARERVAATEAGRGAPRTFEGEMRTPIDQQVDEMREKVIASMDKRLEGARSQAKEINKSMAGDDAGGAADALYRAIQREGISAHRDNVVMSANGERVLRYTGEFKALLANRPDIRRYVKKPGAAPTLDQLAAGADLSDDVLQELSTTRDALDLLTSRRTFKQRRLAEERSVKEIVRQEIDAELAALDEMLEEAARGGSGVGKEVRLLKGEAGPPTPTRLPDAPTESETFFDDLAEQGTKGRRDAALQELEGAVESAGGTRTPEKISEKNAPLASLGVGKGQAVRTEMTEAGEQGLLGAEFSKRSVPRSKIESAAGRAEDVEGGLFEQADTSVQRDLDAIDDTVKQPTPPYDAAPQGGRAQLVRGAGDGSPKAPPNAAGARDVIRRRPVRSAVAVSRKVADELRPNVGNQVVAELTDAVKKGEVGPSIILEEGEDIVDGVYDTIIGGRATASDAMVAADDFTAAARGEATVARSIGTERAAQQTTLKGIELEREALRNVRRDLTDGRITPTQARSRIEKDARQRYEGGSRPPAEPTPSGGAHTVEDTRRMLIDRAEDLSARLGMTPSVFEGFVRTVTGGTWKDLLERTGIQNAAEQLDSMRLINAALDRDRYRVRGRAASRAGRKAARNGEYTAPAFKEGAGPVHQQPKPRPQKSSIDPPPPNGPKRVIAKDGGGDPLDINHQDLVDTRWVRTWNAAKAQFQGLRRTLPDVADRYSVAEKNRLNELDGYAKDLNGRILKGVKKGGVIDNFTARALDGQSVTAVQRELGKGFDIGAWRIAEGKAAEIRPILDSLFERLKIENPDLNYVTNYVTWLRRGDNTVHTLGVPIDLARNISKKSWNRYVLGRIWEEAPSELSAIESLAAYIPVAVRDIHMSPVMKEMGDLIEISSPISQMLFDLPKKPGQLRAGQATIKTVDDAVKAHGMGLIDDGMLGRITEDFERLAKLTERDGMPGWTTLPDNGEIFPLKMVHDRLTGKTGSIETAFDNMMTIAGFRPRAGMRIAIATNNAFYMGLLGLNPGPAIKNLTQVVNTFAEVGVMDFTEGLVRLNRRKGKVFGEGPEVWFPGVREASRENLMRAFETLFEKNLPLFGSVGQTQSVMQSFMTGTEFINRALPFQIGVSQGLREGMSLEKAILKGHRLAEETQHVYDLMSRSPIVLKMGPLGQSGAMLATFAPKQAGFIARRSNRPGFMLRYFGFMGAMQWYTSTVLGVEFPGVFGAGPGGERGGALDFASRAAFASTEFLPDPLSLSPPLQAVQSGGVALSSMLKASMSEAAGTEGAWEQARQDSERWLDDISNAFPAGLILKKELRRERAQGGPILWAADKLGADVDRDTGLLLADPRVVTDGGLALQLPFLSQTRAGGLTRRADQDVSITPFGDLAPGFSLKESTLETLGVRSSFGGQESELRREIVTANQNRTGGRDVIRTAVRRAMQTGDYKKLESAVQLALRSPELGFDVTTLRAAIKGAFETQLVRSLETMNPQDRLKLMASSRRIALMLERAEQVQ